MSKEKSQRDIFSAIANLAHLAWTDKTNIHSAFDLIESYAKEGLSRELTMKEGGTFWVIECFENGKSQGYWAGDSSRCFIPDINNAIHFCRRDDAWRIKRGWHWGDTQVTEHLYLPAPVVSTAAPEPPTQIESSKCKSQRLLHKPNDTLPDGCYCKPGQCMAPVIMGRQMPCRDPEKAIGKTRCCDNGYFGETHDCQKRNPVAPESYKPAEGPELSELIAQQGIKPMKIGHELEIPGLSDEDMEGFHAPAATPVTVEAPEPCQCGDGGCIECWPANFTKEALMEELNAMRKKMRVATPKPIGDVEAVAEQIAGPVLILARGMTYEGFREHIKAILSPFFAPAGPENKEQK